MAYNGPTIAVPDSSPSSVSGQSPRDTPATKLTQISPNGTHPSQSFTSPLDDATEPPIFYLQHFSDPQCLYPTSGMPANISHDPFMANSSGDRRGQNPKRKLSATASPFQPRLSSTLYSHYGTEVGVLVNHDSLNPALVAKRAVELVESDIVPRKFHPHHVPRAAPPLKDGQPQLDMRFVTGPSRYIMVAGLPLHCPRLWLDTVLAVPAIAKSRIAVSDHMVARGMVMLRYDDLRSAAGALEKIASEFPKWTSGFITSQTWQAFAQATCDSLVGDLEGQILVNIHLLPGHGAMSLFNQHEHFAAIMHSRFGVYGDIRSISCITNSPDTLAFRIEFWSAAAASTPGIQHQAPPLPGLRMEVQSFNGRIRHNKLPILGMPVKLLGVPPDPASTMQMAMLSHSLPYYNSVASRFSTEDNVASTSRKWVSPVSRFLDAPSANHNVVDVERIRRGQDVRTTIMLRNIPNKVDQPILKEIVDETSCGRYDFMYLRIDFANNCNVGYAFINFEDSQYIIDFVEAVAGKRWNRFNSDKVAEVSYATIQGKDCLVQKFRNSSVMLEAPSFRPKIFYTGDGPLAGQEEKFPAPDNASKMRRSLENAEHVGLFAPRVGQRFRDEQRRRRSRFDRGTRMAQIEEYGSEEDLHMQAGRLPLVPRSTSHTVFKGHSHVAY